MSTLHSNTLANIEKRKSSQIAGGKNPAYPGGFHHSHMKLFVTQAIC